MLNVSVLPGLRVLIIGAFPPSLYFRLQPAQTQIERGSQTNKGKKGHGQ